MIWKFINLCGFELESGWFEKEGLHEDASFSSDDFDSKYKSVGEYVSKPHDNFKDLCNDIVDNWGDAPPCAKCSMHISISLKSPSLFCSLMDKKFYDYFLKSMENFGKEYPLGVGNESFWKRLRGDNKYCKRNFIPDLQNSFKEKGVNRETRRTQLHYCWGQRKTLENRLFPVFKDSKTAIAAVKAFLETVETYLAGNTLRELVIEDKIIENFNSESTEIGEVIRDTPRPLKKKGFNFFTDYDSNINAHVRILPDCPENLEKIKKKESLLEKKLREFEERHNIKALKIEKMPEIEIAKDYNIDYQKLEEVFPQKVTFKYGYVPQLEETPW